VTIPRRQKKTLLKQMVLEINRQTYDLTLVVQTETIVFFLGSKIKFSSTVLIFGPRSMVALPITERCGASLRGIVKHGRPVIAGDVG